MVIFVALGFWIEDGKEKREIVDWQIAESEKHEEWKVLLDRLVERGAKAENGLKAIIRDGCGGLGQAVELVYAQSVVDQRCIFRQHQECEGQVPNRTQRGGSSRAKKTTDAGSTGCLSRATASKKVDSLNGKEEKFESSFS